VCGVRCPRAEFLVTASVSDHLLERLAANGVHRVYDCGGAITVTREPVPWSEDPFARIFPGTVVRTGLFSEVAPPPGPVLERYAGVAWPGGRF